MEAGPAQVRFFPISKAKGAGMKGGHDYVLKDRVATGDLYACRLCGKSVVKKSRSRLPRQRCPEHVIDPDADLGRVELTETLPLHPKHGLTEGARLRVLDTRANEVWVMGAADIPVKLNRSEFETVDANELAKAAP